MYDPHDAQGDMKLAIMGLHVPHVKKDEPVEAAATAVGEDRERPPSSPPAEEGGSEPDRPQQDSAADTPAMDVVGGVVGALHAKFKPLWLGEADGWTGGDHGDAVEFCAGLRDKSLW